MSAGKSQIRNGTLGTDLELDNSPSNNLNDNEDSNQLTRAIACYPCAKRKVKCDKASPICSSCSKGNLECVYRAPSIRQRKRKLSGAISERLVRYERILQRHGLLPSDADSSPSIEETLEEPKSLPSHELKNSKTGKLLSSQGKSRYIDSHLWRNLGDDEMQRMSDDDGEDRLITDVTKNWASDPLTGAFLGVLQSVFQYHPTYAEAKSLWKTHIENVEPICKILHIPSISTMVESVAQHPELASKSDECLLFAIYHFAVFSMEEVSCFKAFGQSRASLMQKYHFATRQALVNASFLKTTEISVMQAFVLFLLSSRSFYNPHTFWILTGVAIRVAQRMGLHRDGEELGLAPFDVQIRRRLFYQIIPLDGFASQMSGTGIAIMPDNWTTKEPLNVNDNQIWPEMTTTPKEQNGATEMIFCLARACVGKCFAKAGQSVHGAVTRHLHDSNEFELLVNRAETEVEEKYIRYCDVVNPLHFLTVCTARSAITAMRLRNRLAKVKNHTITKNEKKELFQLSQKIIDTDIAAYSHISLSRYKWHMKPFFVWGSWDSLIYILTDLSTSDELSSVEIGDSWSRVEQVYRNHKEVLESRRALHVAIGRLTLKAWDASRRNGDVAEPDFIAALRTLQTVGLKGRAIQSDINATLLDPKSDASSLVGQFNPDEKNSTYFRPPSELDIDPGNECNLDTVDWMFWDQLIQNDRAGISGL